MGSNPSPRTFPSRAPSAEDKSITGKRVSPVMDQVMVIGLVAGFITTLGYVPQIAKGYRTGRMDDVSVFMPLVLIAGMSLWLAYGVLLGDVPIMFWNGVSIALNVAIIAMKFYYGRGAPPVTR